MGNKKQKSKPIPLILQLIDMRKTFSSDVLVCSIIKNSKLYCVLRLKPSKESDIYTVKIICNYGKKPRVWLMSPDILKYNGNNPHHIFGFSQKDNKPELCVCAPANQEWNNQLWISKNFVAWVCSWLNTYEFWAITGEWHYDEYKLNTKAVKK